MNTWKLLPSVALSIVMLLLSACGEEATAPAGPPAVRSILPLRLGLTWSYRTARYKTDGTELYVVFQESEIRTSTVLNKEPWFSFGSSATGQFYSNRADGLYTRYHTINLGLDYWSSPELMLKYPVQEGEVFVDAHDHTVRVESVNQSVRVRGGTFECIVYVETNSNVDSSKAQWRNVLYYCPGVGQVLLEQYSRMPDNTMCITQCSELIHPPQV